MIGRPALLSLAILLLGSMSGALLVPFDHDPAPRFCPAADIQRLAPEAAAEVEELEGAKFAGIPRVRIESLPREAVWCFPQAWYSFDTREITVFPDTFPYLLHHMPSVDPSRILFFILIHEFVHAMDHQRRGCTFEPPPGTSPELWAALMQGHAEFLVESVARKRGMIEEYRLYRRGVEAYSGGPTNDDKAAAFFSVAGQADAILRDPPITMYEIRNPSHYGKPLRHAEQIIRERFGPELQQLRDATIGEDFEEPREWLEASFFRGGTEHWIRSRGAALKTEVIRSGVLLTQFSDGRVGVTYAESGVLKVTIDFEPLCVDAFPPTEGGIKREIGIVTRGRFSAYVVVTLNPARRTHPQSHEMLVAVQELLNEHSEADAATEGVRREARQRVNRISAYDRGGPAILEVGFVGRDP